MLNYVVSTTTMAQTQTIREGIQAVNGLLVEMFNLVDEQLADATNAAFYGDLTLAQTVREKDDQVDALEIRIDKSCEELLAAYHPTGVELRYVISAIKTNTDLERIGDHSKNLAKEVLQLDCFRELLPRTQMFELADTVRAILRQAQEAFVKADRLLARQVLARDRQVDRGYKVLLDTVVGLCQKHPSYTEALVHLVTMCKALERIADHATNIAENVVFSVEGVDLRHKKLRFQAT